MIALLHGILVEATPSQAVVDAGGVGFELGISGTTAAALPAVGEEVRLFTRFRLANDVMSLYGFATSEERAMFDRLIAVSSVGPRMALSVLSKFSVSQLYTVVMAEDAKSMATVPGRGEEDRPAPYPRAQGHARQGPIARRGYGAPARTAAARPRVGLGGGGCARGALSMGFTPQEAELALDGYDDKDMRVEELLGAALKRLGMEA